MEEALAYKNQEQYEDAARVLKRIVRSYPAYPAALGLLGHIYFSVFKEPKKSLPLFRKTVLLSPKSERASLGLFHSLWSLGKEEEAIEEIKRFQVLTNFSCKDYREIIAELNENP